MHGYSETKKFWYLQNPWQSNLVKTSIYQFTMTSYLHCLPKQSSDMLVFQLKKFRCTLLLAMCQASKKCLVSDHSSLMYFATLLFLSVVIEPMVAPLDVSWLWHLLKPSNSIAVEFFTSVLCNETQKRALIVNTMWCLRMFLSDCK